MTKVSKSPERMTFQKEGYVKRCEEKGEEPNQDYLDLFENTLKQYDSRFDDPASRQNNLEYDLVTTDWILEKARTSEAYAQNIYAALCNNDFIPIEVIPILRQNPDKDFWSCSWRYAGGIVADMRQEGDYIDWYCSGIRNVDYDEEVNKQWDERKYVSEGFITDEIRSDLQRLGWVPAPGGDWEDINSLGEKVKK